MLPGLQSPSGPYISSDPNHRSLTKEEIADLREHAQNHVPEFGGPHNAGWEEHHPIAREVWEKAGKKPPDEAIKADKDAKAKVAAKAKKVEEAEKQLAALKAS